jgi:hypothetical protein
VQPTQPPPGVHTNSLAPNPTAARVPPLTAANALPTKKPPAEAGGLVRFTLNRAPVYGHPRAKWLMKHVKSSKFKKGSTLLPSQLA